MIGFLNYKDPIIQVHQHALPQPSTMETVQFFEKKQLRRAARMCQFYNHKERSSSHIGADKNVNSITPRSKFYEKPEV
jgi:hypothetical protein